MIETDIFFGQKIGIADPDLSEIPEIEVYSVINKERFLEDIFDVLETHHKPTYIHSRWVAGLSYSIAEKLGLAPEETQRTYLVALVHDVGKIFEPKESLDKPGQLNKAEKEEMGFHPVYGQSLIADFLPQEIALAVRQHHERIDGSGYPDGKKEEEILLDARIVGVADCVMAKIEGRPYALSVPLYKAIEAVQGESGKLFDPAVVDALLDLYFEGSLEEFNDIEPQIITARRQKNSEKWWDILRSLSNYAGKVRIAS